MKISELPEAPLPLDDTMLIAYEFVDGRPHRCITIGEYLRLRKLTYSHRNGETTPPTAEGSYWFNGHHGTHPLQDVISVRIEKFYDCADVFGSDESNYLNEFSGQWWGPLVAPWETNE